MTFEAARLAWTGRQDVYLLVGHDGLVVKLFYIMLELLPGEEDLRVLLAVLLDLHGYHLLLGASRHEWEVGFVVVLDPQGVFVGHLLGVFL